MSLKRGILAISAGLMVCQSAWAGLGDKTAEAKRDQQLVKGASSTVDQSSSCYSVIHIDAEGIHVIEYVSKASDTVFMVKTVSRVPLNTSQFLSESLASEVQAAKKTFKAPRSKTHNHEALIAETEHVEMRVSKTNMIHRSTAILKTAVPSCVSNPESLQ